MDTKEDFVVRFAATAAEQACKSLAYYATKKDKYFATDLLQRCLHLRRDVDEAMASIDVFLRELQELAYVEEQNKVKTQLERVNGVKLVA